MIASAEHHAGTALVRSTLEGAPGSPSEELVEGQEVGVLMIGDREARPGVEKWKAGRVIAGASSWARSQQRASRADGVSLVCAFWVLPARQVRRIALQAMKREGKAIVVGSGLEVVHD